MSNTWKNILFLLGAGIIGMIIGALIWGNDAADTSTPKATSQPTAWTCSMHPQIKQPTEGLCPICGMDLVPASTVKQNTDPTIMQLSPEALQLAKVQTATVAASPAQKTITMNGIVTADERRQFTQTAHFSGRIEQLYVNYTGAEVAAGQPLAAIYSPELVMAQKELLEAKRFATVNPTLLEAARNKLMQWKLTAAQIAVIEQEEMVRESFPILADRSGVITKKYVNFGDHLMTGAPMYDMTDLSVLWVLFDAYPEDVAWLQEGDEVTLSFTGVPGIQRTATIDFIDPVVDPQTRVLHVRVVIDNADGKLRPAMQVVGQVSASQPGDTPKRVVPRSAVLWTGERSVVYVQLPGNEEPAFQLREVTLGTSLNDAYVVIDGLAEGEEIVVEGTYFLDAASALEDKPSMMNTTAGLYPSAFSGFPDYSDKIPTKLSGQLANITRSYLDLQRALVEADVGAAQMAASALLAALPGEASFSGSMAEAYWTTQRNSLHTNAQHIYSAQTVDQQREAFIPLSIAMIRTTLAFGIKDTLYLVYCPMANNDEGAYWLSEANEVLNPYFGDMMLRCGSVENEIHP